MSLFGPKVRRRVAGNQAFLREEKNHAYLEKNNKKRKIHTLSLKSVL